MHNGLVMAVSRQQSQIPRVYLLSVSAVAGAAVLGLEVLAARTMAPAIGTGSVAWSSLLAVALGTLAAGNLLGGFLAERFSVAGILRWTLIVAASVLAVLSQLYPCAVNWAARLPLVWASILASILIQFVPMLMLGVISPAILTAGRKKSPGGRWAGAVLASGSAGGIAGSLVIGLVALPRIGIAGCYLFIAAALVVTALPSAIFRRRWASSVILLLILVSAVMFWPHSASPNVIQSRYGQIEVRSSEDGAVLLIDGLPQTGIVGSIEQWAGLREGYLLEAALLFADQPRHALVIGLGGGLAHRLLESHGVECHSVEIDPTVVEVARRDFGFEGEVSITDGRAYLRRTPAEWDIIVLDVCTADRLPAHLFTIEALQLAKERLGPGGVLAIQFIGDDGPWSASVVRTVQEVFGQCVTLARPAWFDPVGPRWIFASEQAFPMDLQIKFAEQEHLCRIVKPTNDGSLLTDDHFPAELQWARTAQLWRQLYADTN